MIEVFKTNVTDRQQANELLERIRISSGYEASFDLEDCDKILRVISPSGPVAASALISILKDHGCDAEVLPD